MWRLLASATLNAVFNIVHQRSAFNAHDIYTRPAEFMRMCGSLLQGDTQSCNSAVNMYGKKKTIARTRAPARDETDMVQG